MTILLGCIADDLTGATDLCSTLVGAGMRTIQLTGTPPPGLDLPDADAATVALKSRTCPASEAVALSLGALGWLRDAGATRFLFKYCSTFDSTAAGNIGPVADALLNALGADIAIVCPAFPDAGRTVFKGHLFVGDRLLSDSPMRDHPLTPMTDSSLVRVLGAQTPHPVGLVQHATVAAGPGAIRDRLAQLRGHGCRYAVCDAVANDDLRTLGIVGAEMILVTGGSGIATGLPERYRAAGLLAAQGDAGILPVVGGAAAVLAGSCSAATRAQVERFAATHPARKLSPLDLATGFDLTVAAALGWAVAQLPRATPLLYASAPPDEVGAAQGALGRDRAGQLVEAAFGAIASGLAQAGVRRLVVAGGETSGAVVAALGVPGLRIGAPIDVGVPACVSIGREPALALALKSGNFGGVDFFERAVETLR